MRILFSALAEYSHLMPVLVPVAETARRAGHDVLVATGNHLVEEVGRRGLPVLPLPNVLSFDEIRNDPDLISRTGFDLSVLARVGKETVVTPPELAARTFAGPSSLPFAEDLIAGLAEAKPDLIVHEPTNYGAYYAAEALGIPRAVLETSPMFPFAAEEILRQVNAQRAALGLAPTEDPRHLYRAPYLGVVPEAFYPAEHRLPGSRYYRPPTVPAGQVLDPAVAALPADRPLVLVSLGSVATRLAAEGNQLMPTIVEAMAALPVTAVVALGKGNDPEQWTGSRPDNVHLTSFVQQQLLLPACDLFVTHGGFSGVRESLGAGVPMVVLPMFAEQPGNADRVAELGLGLRLDIQDVSRDSLAAAAGKVLGDQGYRLRARGMQRAFLGLPDFDQLVTDLAAAC